MLFTLAILLTAIPATTFAASSKTVPEKVILNDISSSAPNKITISWKKAANATNYVIYYKKITETKWTKIATVSSKKTSYTHISSKKHPIVFRQFYDYTVRAYNKDTQKYGPMDTMGLAIQSRPVTVDLKELKIHPERPAAVLSWHEVSNCDRYIIYRKTATNPKWKKIATVKSNVLEYIDENPVKGVENTYTVRAYFSKTKKYSEYDREGFSTTISTPRLPKYTYELIPLNEAYAGDGIIFGIYIKTNNPDANSLHFSYSTDYSSYITHFDDIRYVKGDVRHNAARKVAGGYFYTIIFEKAGFKNLTLYWYPDGSQAGVERFRVAELNVNVKDFSTEGKKWAKNVLKDVTTDKMSKEEKMDALCKYVLDNFKYQQNDEWYIFSRFATDSKPYWEHRYIDCLDSTYIMRYFAKMLGLKSESTYAGYLNHHYATVYFEDGKSKIYDACPNPLTGFVTSPEYVL